MRAKLIRENGKTVMIIDIKKETVEIDFQVWDAVEQSKTFNIPLKELKDFIYHEGGL